MLSPRLLVLALLPCARAGWVEISQQHYRKPVRLTDRLTDLKHIYQEPARDTFILSEDKWHRNEPENNWNTPNQKHIYRDTDLGHKEWHTQVTDLPANGLKSFDGMRYPAKNVNSDPLQNVTRQYFSEDRPVRLNPFLQSDTSNRNAFITKGDTDTKNAYFEEVSQSERNSYLNQSLTEPMWGQHAYRPNNEGGKTKWTDVDLDDWGDDINSKSQYEPSRIGNKPNETKNKNLDERSKYEEKDISEPDKGERVSGKIERIPNIGSVQRVQLSNTPVKSPAVKVSDLNRRNEVNIQRPHDEFGNKLDVTTDIFNSREDSKISDFKNTLSTVEQVSNINDGEIKIPSKNENTINSTTYFQKHYFSQKPDFEHVTYIRKGDTKHKETKSPELIISETAIDISDQHREDDIPNKNKNKPDIALKHVETTTHANDIENYKNQKLHHEKNENVKEQIKTSEKEEIPSSGEIKVNTIEKILKFMKVVADTISKNTRNGANGKVTYLNELKHALLANIKGRIDATWPDDPLPPAPGRRHSRAAAPRGHVEFPSSESSLMTISFLTFAVFLIKLVLQVIHTYKHKAMLMAPLMVSTAGRAALKLRDSH